ncbi:pirin family protein [Bdellovibrio bacteriovorus]|uniref:pirin family protein n=1 Tax=Bdellovibrio bacteriovorus TaxID=959 RepID=UPI0035A5FD35
MRKRFVVLAGISALLVLALFHFAILGDSSMNSKLSEIQVRPYSQLPEMNLGWLSLKDHFIATVGPYSGRGEQLKNLLVLADAKIQPKSRFPDHPHNDMEILTWVVHGKLQHLDNKGTNQEVPAEHLQLMSARDGIFHAEGNLSNEPLRLLQIWIHPNAKSGTPVVQQAGLNQQGFNLLAGPSAAPLIIRQDVWLYAAKIESDEQVFEIPEDKFAYAVSIGNLSWNGKELKDGDGLLAQSGKLAIKGTGQVIVILQNR